MSLLWKYFEWSEYTRERIGYEELLGMLYLSSSILILYPETLIRCPMFSVSTKISEKRNGIKAEVSMISLIQQ